MKNLTKPEAAQLLGCAERQIQRYAQAGRLTVEYVQEGRTRRALYSEAEVQALKQQQAAPELRGIVQPPTGHSPLTIDHQQLTTTNPAPDTRHPTPLALPPQAMQVLQMLGAAVSVEEGKCVSVEEMKFDKLFVRADGTTRMSGVSVSRYSARA